jgi:hypothetical protein
MYEELPGKRHCSPDHAEIKPSNYILCNDSDASNLVLDSTGCLHDNKSNNEVNDQNIKYCINNILLIISF